MWHGTLILCPLFWWLLVYSQIGNSITFISLECCFVGHFNMISYDFHMLILCFTNICCFLVILWYWCSVFWNWFIWLSYTLGPEYRVMRRSPLRQFVHARTINEYDVTMLVSYIRVTSQINCGDVTILNQKRLSLTTMAKSAIDNCFGGIECSGHQIACKK